MFLPLFSGNQGEKRVISKMSERKKVKRLLEGKNLREMNAGERKRKIESCERMNKIFDPWGGRGLSFYVQIAIMLELGLVSYTVEQVFLEQPKDFAKVSRSDGYETDAHLTLKHNACLILRKLGEDKPIVEKMDGYDVYSPKLKVRIECGHTDPERLPWSFESDNVAKFWVLQYPREGESSASLYKFRPSKDCKKILRAYSSEIGRQAMAALE